MNYKYVCTVYIYNMYTYIINIYILYFIYTSGFFKPDPLLKTVPCRFQRRTKNGDSEGMLPIREF